MTAERYFQETGARVITQIIIYFYEYIRQDKGENLENEQHKCI